MAAKSGTEGALEENGSGPRRAAVFGATGGIGAALVDRLLLNPTIMCVYAGGRTEPETGDPRVAPFAFDVLDESSIAAACAGMGNAPPDLVIVATGILSPPGSAGPEKSVAALDGEQLARMFAVNAAGPMLIAKHIKPVLPRDKRAVFAALSARVGSIEDNGLGGWYSYRASKAALNMMLRSFAIELARTHTQAVVAALHPGTVDTDLSRPFQTNVPDSQLFTPQRSAAALLDVIEGLRPSDSGKLFSWDGATIPY